jgi:peptidoglycan/LPS O-acetylase OafA/YrhL
VADLGLALTHPRPKLMRSETRISVIEAMRGIASVSVALFHFSGQLVSEIPRLLQSFGWLGVDVFFVISGFVIPLSLYGGNYSLLKFPSFLLRRLVRLEPPYIISICLVLVMWRLSAMSPGFQGTNPNYSLAQIAFHLFYMIPLTSYPWLSPVYWSLAYEFVFYILVGLTFSYLIDRKIEFTILAVAAVSAVCFYMQSQFDVRPLEFAVGILLMRIVVDRTQRMNIGTWIAICLAIIFWIGGLKIGGAVFLAAAAIIFLRDVKYGRWAFVLGSISYSLYLTHVVIGGRVINLGRRLGEGPVYDVVLIVAALCVSIIFAFVFARWIEGPATSASRKIGSLAAPVMLKPGIMPPIADLDLPRSQD